MECAWKILHQCAPWASCWLPKIDQTCGSGALSRADCGPSSAWCWLQGCDASACQLPSLSTWSGLQLLPCCRSGEDAFLGSSANKYPTNDKLVLSHKELQYILQHPPAASAKGIKPNTTKWPRKKGLAAVLCNIAVSKPENTQNLALVNHLPIIDYWKESEIEILLK